MTYVNEHGFVISIEEEENDDPIRDSSMEVVFELENEIMTETKPSPDSILNWRPEKLADAFSIQDMEMTSPVANILVVLDCANIGWGYGINSFKANGVQIAVEHFARFANTRVVAFIPSSYLRRKLMTGSRPVCFAFQKGRQCRNSSCRYLHENVPATSAETNALMETDDTELLNELWHNRRLSMVPASDHDDEYILSYAKENHGFVVSNDLFNDHVRNVADSSSREDTLNMQHWLQRSRCGFTFIEDELVLNPASVLVEVLKSQKSHPTQVPGIDSITFEIEVLKNMDDSYEKYCKIVELLLIRARMYIELGQLGLSWSDTAMVLSIQVHSEEARNIQALLSSLGLT